MTSICLRSVGVSGRDRLSTFMEVIFLDENGAGLLLPTELWKVIYRVALQSPIEATVHPDGPIFEKKFHYGLTRMGEGDRIGDGDDIRLICLSGFILSSTIAVKFEFLFHVQHKKCTYKKVLYFL